MGHLEPDVGDPVLCQGQEVGEEGGGGLLPRQRGQQLAGEEGVGLAASPVVGGGQAGGEGGEGGAAELLLPGPVQAGQHDGQHLGGRLPDCCYLVLQKNRLETEVLQVFVSPGPE